MMSSACVITSGNVTAIPLFHGDQPTYEIALSSSKLKYKRSISDFCIRPRIPSPIGSSGTTIYLYIHFILLSNNNCHFILYFNRRCLPSHNATRL